MINEFKLLLNFIRKCLLQWFSILVFLPTVYDLLHAYFPEPIKSFELPYYPTVAFVLLSIFLSIYRTWREEYLQNISVLEKYSEFHLTPKFSNLVCDKKIAEVEEEILSLRTEMENYPQLGVFDLIAVSFPPSKNRESISKYIKELQDYQEDLKKYFTGNYQIIVFELKIESSKYDENVTIRSTLDKGSFLDSTDLELPWKPTPSYHLYSGASLAPAQPNTTLSYRTNIYISDTDAQADIAYIKKEQPAFFFNDPIFLLDISQGTELNVEITSKNSNGIKKFLFNIDPLSIDQKTDLVEIED